MRRRLRSAQQALRAAGVALGGERARGDIPILRLLMEQISLATSGASISSPIQPHIEAEIIVGQNSLCSGGA